MDSNLNSEYDYNSENANEVLDTMDFLLQSTINSCDIKFKSTPSAIFDEKVNVRTIKPSIEATRHFPFPPKRMIQSKIKKRASFNGRFGHRSQPSSFQKKRSSMKPDINMRRHSFKPMEYNLEFISRINPKNMTFILPQRLKSFGTIIKKNNDKLQAHYEYFRKLSEYKKNRFFISSKLVQSCLSHLLQNPSIPESEKKCIKECRALIQDLQKENLSLPDIFQAYETYPKLFVSLVPFVSQDREFISQNLPIIVDSILPIKQIFDEVFARRLFILAIAFCITCITSSISVLLSLLAIVTFLHDVMKFPYFMATSICTLISIMISVLCAMFFVLQKKNLHTILNEVYTSVFSGKSKSI